jgi:hypothetical protein
MASKKKWIQILKATKFCIFCYITQWAKSRAWVFSKDYDRRSKWLNHVKLLKKLGWRPWESLSEKSEIYNSMQIHLLFQTVKTVEPDFISIKSDLKNTHPSFSFKWIIDVNVYCSKKSHFFLIHFLYFKLHLLFNVNIPQDVTRFGLSRYI